MQPYPPPPQPHPWPSGLPYPTPVTWDPYAATATHPVHGLDLDELCAEYARLSASVTAARTQRDALEQAITERSDRLDEIARELPTKVARWHGTATPDVDAESETAAAVEAEAPWDRHDRERRTEVAEALFAAVETSGGRLLNAAVPEGAEPGSLYVRDATDRAWRVVVQTVPFGDTP